MKNSIYKVVGVMSGTSLDGVDICHARFEKKKNWGFKIITAKTFPYPKKWKTDLQNAINLNETQLNKLDQRYSIFLSKLIKDFIEKYDIEDNALISNHGHTVFHDPSRSITKQIGNMVELKTYLKNEIVCDFRQQDVQLGGQGAPLVPIGDQLLFYDYEYCLNLGGFANISFNKDGNRIAYDICPVNIVLNFLSNKIGLDYDENGHQSALGELKTDLLNKLNALDFYRYQPPKSLGFEWVKDNIFPILESSHYSVNDILRTYTEHAAYQIGNALQSQYNSKVLITGGGAYNAFLIERLLQYTNHKLVIPDSKLVEFKEALIFGLLGVLKLRSEPNCLKSVTGARYNHSSGKIY